ncbi:MAG: aldehyde ferredoxin oxidoreductase family protein [Desulfobacterales bacterium]|nr:aldehyde ferredoxin oxidoreductase family protein [Desulfobacterales bacterium]
MKEITASSNRVLEIDLSTRDIKEFLITDDERRMYLGGKGLGLKYLYERLKPGIDPLGKENILAFMTGILMGTGAPCTRRFAALTKSPLTNIMLSSSCGGPFGMACKSAGYEGLLIRGKSDKPVYLVIDEDNVQFKDASHLWGLDTQKTQEALDLGKKGAALAIGPAGENLVLYANIATGHRFLGRGGMGAVMGSKRLKSIVAYGNKYKMLPKEPDKFEKVRKKAIRYIDSNLFTAGFYRKYGTTVHVNLCNEGNILPVNNFQSSSHAKAMDVSGEAMQKRYQTSYSSCKSCTILCGHRGTYKDGTHQIPEYETVGLLGPNLGIYDTDLITAWNNLCSRLGMDTISAGCTLSYAMEAGEKGLFRTDLKFGSPQGINDTLEDIAHRRGQGDELAGGTRRLSEKYGGKEFAIQIKGLEMAAYDPRGSWGQGLSYAVANRGGCHLSAYLVGLEVFLHLLNPYKTYAKPEFTKLFESLTCCINSLHICQFTMYAYTLEPPLIKYTPRPLLGLIMQYLPKVAVSLLDTSVYKDLFSSTTGMDISNREFLKAGDRIHVLERYMNCMEGISRKDDTLPDRFLKEGRETDPDSHTVSLDKMLDKYYKIRGYDNNGIPTKRTLMELGIL